MFTQVCVAACSFKPRKFDVSTNSDRLESLFRRAAASGAELAVAPEGALDGYVVMSIIEGSQPVERMYEAAVSLDGPEIRRFLDLARELRMCMLFGLAQRLGTDVYNCAIYIDSLGQICGTYHKMQLYG